MTLDQVCTEDVTLKSLTFTQHEFVKYTDIRKLIAHSNQHLLHKISDKDKLAQAMKSWLVKLDDRVKLLE